MHFFAVSFCFSRAQFHFLGRDERTRTKLAQNPRRGWLVKKTTRQRCAFLIHAISWHFVNCAKIMFLPYFKGPKFFSLFIPIAYQWFLTNQYVLKSNFFRLFRNDIIFWYFSIFLASAGQFRSSALICRSCLKLEKLPKKYLKCPFWRAKKTWILDFFYLYLCRLMFLPVA